MADADNGLARDKGNFQGHLECHPQSTKPQEFLEHPAPDPSAPHSQSQTTKTQPRQRRNSRPTPVSTQPLPKILVAGKYRLLSRIGQGSFGELYRAEGIKYGELVAIKLERAAVKHPLLAREAKIYGILQGGAGIPHMRYYGIEGEFNVMVLDLLGPTLEDLLNVCGRAFSMKTILMLADQILIRIEYLHLKCFVHRDVKPDNFLMGRGRHNTQVYMIDFGLAKKFFSHTTQMHIEYTENKELVGTARYASVRAHYAEQGRRDDLESVGYLLLYFRRGRLPWQGIRAASEVQKYERIAESKASVPLDVLCSGLPMEFLLYLKYCRNLEFEQKPDYTFLRQLFKTVFRNQYKRFDFHYDWDLKRQKQAQHQKQGDCRGHKAREDTDRDCNRKAENGRNLTGKKNPERDRDRQQERNPATDRNGHRTSVMCRAGYTHRERGRERDHARDQDRHKDQCPEKRTQACSCSFHRRQQCLRDRHVGQASEQRRDVAEKQTSSHRQPPQGL